MLENLSLKQSLNALSCVLGLLQSQCHWEKIKGSRSQKFISQCKQDLTRNTGGFLLKFNALYIFYKHDINCMILLCLVLETVKRQQSL